MGFLITKSKYIGIYAAALTNNLVVDYLNHP